MVCGVRPLAHRVHASPPGVLRAQLNRAEPHALRRTCVPVPGPKLAARRWRVRGHGCFWAHTPAAKLAVPEHPKSPLSRRRLPREPRHRERRMGEGSAANAAKVVSSEPHGATVTRFDKLIPVPVVFTSVPSVPQQYRIGVWRRATGCDTAPRHPLRPPDGVASLLPRMMARPGRPLAVRRSTLGFKNRCEYEILACTGRLSAGGWQKRA